MEYDVGIDVGSVSINCVMIDDHGKVVYEAPYLRHFGLVFEEVHKLLKHIASLSFHPGIRSVSFTGVQGSL